MFTFSKRFAFVDYTHLSVYRCNKIRFNQLYKLHSTGWTTKLCICYKFVSL